MLRNVSFVKYLPKKKFCTALLLHNMAQPGWASIHCQKPLLKHFACFKDKDNLRSEQNDCKIDMCAKQAVRHRKKCVSIVWLQNQNRSSFSHKMIHSQLQLKHTEQLVSIFGNIPANFYFLSFEYNTNDLMIITQVIWANVLGKLTFNTKPVFNSLVSGFFFCESNITTKNFKQFSNLCHCEDGTTISVKCLCDGIMDCPGRRTSDETFCDCKIVPERDYYNKLCKHNLDNYSSTCSPLLLKNSNGQCVLYSDNISQVSTNETIWEAKLDQMNLTESSTSPCASPYNFLCTQHKQSTCYSIEDVCSYRLDIRKEMYPCQHGSHLANCKMFECNMMFKCPGYYCIPWSYVCDGKWDCPFGVDECAARCKSTNCSAMYKCLLSGICVHLGNTCDGILCNNGRLSNE